MLSLILVEKPASSSVTASCMAAIQQLGAHLGEGNGAPTVHLFTEVARLKYLN